MQKNEVVTLRQKQYSKTKRNIIVKKGQLVNGEDFISPIPRETSSSKKSPKLNTSNSKMLSLPQLTSRRASKEQIMQMTTERQKSTVTPVRPRDEAAQQAVTIA